MISYCCDVDHPRGNRVLGFLDLPLTFNCRRSDGSFTFKTIYVYKVYTDFRIKILGRLFLNDKQMFQIICNPLRCGGSKSLYILKAAGLFKYV